MKKKVASHRKHHAARAARSVAQPESYLVIVRSWMLLVMFALMLGLGAVVGTYLNHQADVNSPAVAGAEIEVR